MIKVIRESERSHMSNGVTRNALARSGSFLDINVNFAPLVPPCSPTHFIYINVPTSVPYHSHDTDMAANIKYQPASQRDSFEESSYSQAPPSYQAEAHSNDGLLGAPRGEDDNIPDDFKVSTRFVSRGSFATKLQLTVV